MKTTESKPWKYIKTEPFPFEKDMWSTIQIENFVMDITTPPKISEERAKEIAQRIVKCVNMHDELVESLKIMSERLANMIDEKEGRPVEDDEVIHAFNLIKKAEQK